MTDGTPLANLLDRTTTSVISGGVPTSILSHSDRAGNENIQVREAPGLPRLARESGKRSPFVRADVLYNLASENRELFHVLAQKNTLCVCLCLHKSEDVSLEGAQNGAEEAVSGLPKDSASPRTPLKDLAV